MTDTVERLEAEAAIRRLVGLYCDAVNRRDADAAGLLFASDAAIRIADGPEIAGRTAITEGMRRTFGAFVFLRQQSEASIIDIDGNTARARLSVFETTLKPEQDTLSLLWGFYEDQYARLAEGWRFRRRRYTLQLRSAMPLAKVQAVEGLDLGFTFKP